MLNQFIGFVYQIFINLFFFDIQLFPSSPGSITFTSFFIQSALIQHGLPSGQISSLIIVLIMVPFFHQTCLANVNCFFVTFLIIHAYWNQFWSSSRSSCFVSLGIGHLLVFSFHRFRVSILRFSLGPKYSSHMKC